MFPFYITENTRKAKVSWFFRRYKTNTLARNGGMTSYNQLQILLIGQEHAARIAFEHTKISCNINTASLFICFLWVFFHLTNICVCRMNIVKIMAQHLRIFILAKVLLLLPILSYSDHFVLKKTLTPIKSIGLASLKNII